MSSSKWWPPLPDPCQWRKFDLRRTSFQVEVGNTHYKSGIRKNHGDSPGFLLPYWIAVALSIDGMVALLNVRVNGNVCRLYEESPCPVARVLTAWFPNLKFLTCLNFIWIGGETRCQMKSWSEANLDPKWCAPPRSRLGVDNVLSRGIEIKSAMLMRWALKSDNPWEVS